MNHEKTYELIEPFVFGTLDETEAEAVEAHIDTGCSECANRLREVAELSVRLATSVPQHEPSPKIKQRVMEAIAVERAPGRAHPRAHVTPRRQGFGWMPAVASLAAIALLLVWSLLLRQDRDVLRVDLGEARAEIARLNSDLTAFEDARHLMGLPCTQFIDLTGVDPNPQAFGKVVMHPNENNGIVYLYRLPQASTGMEYQLWMLKEGKPTSIGVFTVADDGSAILRMETPTEPDAFAVTIEPAGGLPAPSGMMYLTGPIKKSSK